MKKDLIIAIDGYSSCGKSTLAKELAKKLNYNYLDSGAMYRAVTLYFMQNRITPSNLDAIRLDLSNIHIEFKHNKKTKSSDTYLNKKNVEQEIRGMAVSNQASLYSAIKEIRTEMVHLQRKAATNGGIVMDGRDIGTNVFPNADLKIFMTADPEIRAMRRQLELADKGVIESLDSVRNNLAERDRIDTTRQENPLIQAKDAKVLDNSNITREQQLEIALNWVKEL